MIATLAHNCVRSGLSLAEARAEAFIIFDEWIAPTLKRRKHNSFKDNRARVEAAYRRHPYDINRAHRESGVKRSTFFRHLRAIRDAE